MTSTAYSVLGNILMLLGVAILVGAIGMFISLKLGVAAAGIACIFIGAALLGKSLGTRR